VLWASFPVGFGDGVDENAAAAATDHVDIAMQYVL